jgi:hypothetical protein
VISDIAINDKTGVIPEDPGRVMISDFAALMIRHKNRRSYLGKNI